MTEEGKQHDETLSELASLPLSERKAALSQILNELKLTEKKEGR